MAVYLTVAAIQERDLVLPIALLVGVVVLFAVIYYLGHGIEPDTRRTENDEHLKRRHR
jgi:hypothetical protein